METRFYLLGGKSGTHQTTKTIAAFNTMTKKWERSGELKQARQGHRVIIHQTEIIVVGGSGKLSTERCIIRDESIECKSVDPVLEHYSYYPEMIRVPYDYCQK